MSVKPTLPALSLPMTACALGLLGVSSAAMAQASLPQRAPPAVLDWSQTFPVTPLFTEWTRLKYRNPQTNQEYNWYLHSASLHWWTLDNGSTWLKADMIFYNDGSDGTPTGYKRYLVDLSCNANKVFAFEAVVPVAVSPDSYITPTTAVHAGDYWDVAPPKDSDFYHDLCYDESLHQRFLAR